MASQTAALRISDAPAVCQTSPIASMSGKTPTPFSWTVSLLVDSSRSRRSLTHQAPPRKELPVEDPPASSSAVRISSWNSALPSSSKQDRLKTRIGAHRKLSSHWLRWFKSPLEMKPRRRRPSSWASSSKELRSAQTCSPSFYRKVPSHALTTTRPTTRQAKSDRCPPQLRVCKEHLW